MHLARALRLGPTPRLALVGAGGKTSALFRLGRELLETTSPQVTQGGFSTVLLSATTHLAVDQLELADRHFILQDHEDVVVLEADLPGGVLLLTGPQVGDDRASGLKATILDRLLSLADERGLPLIVEADGSRRRPLKAPAGHEPVIPAWVGGVVVVAGLSGLGKPLAREWVHRPERFSALAGIPLGAPVTPQALLHVLTSPQGGLKGIPDGARRVALLNQADTPTLLAQAYRLAEDLLGDFHAVLVATLASPLNVDKDQKAVFSWLAEAPVIAVHERVAGIILAAGASTRLGRAKQVLPWRGQPLVRHVAQTALGAGLSPVVVVTGFAAPEVSSALEGLPLTLVYNQHWQAGQSTSLAAGLGALPPEIGAAVFLLADQPQVPVGLVRGLVETHALTLSPLVAPQVQGRRANPVLFDRLTFPDLLSLSGDVGGRELFSHFRVAWLPWHDVEFSLDVDTQEDYERLLGDPKGFINP